MINLAGQRFLYGLALLLAVGPVSTVLLTTSEVPIQVRILASLVWLSCLMPAVVYLRTPREERRPIPFLPIFGLLFAIYFSLPVVLGIGNQWLIIHLESEVDYSRPIELVLLGWWLLLAGYGLVALLFSRREKPKAKAPAWPDGITRAAGLLLLGGGLLADLSRRVVSLPGAVAGAVQFAVFLSWFGIALLILLDCQGKLSKVLRVVLVGSVALSAALQVSTGSMANLANLVFVVLLAIWIGKGHFPPRWIVGAVAVTLLMIILKGVMPAYRLLTWYTSESLSVTQRVEMIWGVVEQQVESAGVLATVQESAELVSGRVASIDLFADVIRRTPERVPYWGGETYLSLVGTFVPRFIWADKPTKRLGQDFGHRYGYLSISDTVTSINLPVLVEFYANFGELGVILGMFGIGMVIGGLQTLVNRPSQPPIRSLAGVVLLVPLFNMDSDLSLVYGGLLMNGVALWLVFAGINRYVAALEGTRSRWTAAPGVRHAHPASGPAGIAG